MSWRYLRPRKTKREDAHFLHITPWIELLINIYSNIWKTFLAIFSWSYIMWEIVPKLPFSPDPIYYQYYTGLRWQRPAGWRSRPTSPVQFTVGTKLVQNERLEMKLPYIYLSLKLEVGTNVLCLRTSLTFPRNLSILLLLLSSTVTAISTISSDAA